MIIKLTELKIYFKKINHSPESKQILNKHVQNEVLHPDNVYTKIIHLSNNQRNTKF